MPDERSRLITRISELRAVIQDTQRDDVRVVIREAIAECERRVIALDDERTRGLPLEPAPATDPI
jgi:hypothetical protein